MEHAGILELGPYPCSFSSVAAMRIAVEVLLGAVAVVGLVTFEAVAVVDVVELLAREAVVVVVVLVAADAFVMDLVAALAVVVVMDLVECNPGVLHVETVVDRNPVVEVLDRKTEPEPWVLP
jgi:hypothetical protein